MFYEIIFDCETKKFFDEIEGNDPAKLGVSIVSAYIRKVEGSKEIDGKMFSFWEKDFDKMFILFEKAHRVIGFNSISFDVPALSPYLPKHWSKLPHFDILDLMKKATGKRASLDSIAKATLGNTKNDSGENAVKYWRENSKESLAKLQKYCEMDVAITRDVYDFVLKNGYLKYKNYWNEINEVKLDFSYPEIISNPQASLF